jgi:ribosomal protein S14
MNVKKLIGDIPELKPDNYHLWASQVETNLLYNHVKSAIETPAQGVAGPAIDPKIDETARAIILSRLSMSMKHKLKELSTAKAMWVYIKKYYAQSSKAAQIENWTDMVTLERKPNEPIHELVDRATDIQSKLNAAGIVMEDKDMREYIYKSFGPGFLPITTVLRTIPDLNMPEMIQRLIEHEKRLPQKQSNGGAMMADEANDKSDENGKRYNGRMNMRPRHDNKSQFMMRFRPKFRPRPNFQRGFAHPRQNMKRYGQPPHNNTYGKKTCWHCGKPGHVMRECRHLAREAAGQSMAHQFNGKYMSQKRHAHGQANDNYMRNNGNDGFAMAVTTPAF